MKKLVAVQEIEGEGLVALLGKRVTLFCANYIYSGVLDGVNDSCVKLVEAGVVYETGSFSDSRFKDIQHVGFPVYVQKNSIESFFETNKK